MQTAFIGKDGLNWHAFIRAEIAKIRGTSPRRMLDLVGTTPVCGSTLDGARQYFYRRADIEREVDIRVEKTPALSEGESR